MLIELGRGAISRYNLANYGSGRLAHFWNRLLPQHRTKLQVSMKLRITLVSISIVLAFIAALYQSPSSQAVSQSPSSQAVSQSPSSQAADTPDWLKLWWQARLTAQINGDQAAAWLRLPPSRAVAIEAAQRATLWQSHRDINLADNFNNILTPRLIGLVANSSQNQQVNDPNQETGARVQNNTASAVSGNNIVIAYNDIGTQFAAVSYSNDGGQSWQESHIPAYPDGTNLGSGVVAGRGDNFYYAGVAAATAGNGAIILSRSTDRGRSWSVPKVVFAEPISITQDKPWIAVDNSATSNAGFLYVSWTDITSVSRPGTRIVIASSYDQGDTFSTVLGLGDFDRTFSQQGSTIAVGPSGDVNIAWGNQSLNGIDFTRSTDAGRTFSIISTAASLPVYQLTGTLLNSHFAANGLPSLAADTSNSNYSGSLYIVFSAHSLNQDGDKSDVYLVSFNSGGKRWSKPIKLNDDNTSTEQFMPSVAVANDGTVAVMWYDRRNDPIHNALLDIYATVSTDGGQTFSANKRITTGNWLLMPTPEKVRANYHGDYNQLSALTNSTGFCFNWGDDRSGLDANVYAAQLAVNDLINQQSLILSPITASQTVIAGQNTEFKLRVSAHQGVLDLNGSSDNSGISFEFVQTPNSNDLVVRVLTNTGVTAGTHPIVINASADGLTTSTTLRLDLVAPGEFASIPVNVSNSATRSIQPHGVVDSQGGVHTVWTDDISGNFRVNYSRQLPGSNFSKSIDLSRDVNISVNPQVAVDSNNNLHVVWQECQDQTCLTMYTRSTDQGVSFESTRSLSNSIQFSEMPAVVTNPKGEVLICWDGVRSINAAQFEIFVARSTDGGLNFTDATSIVSSNQRNFFNTAAASDGQGNSYLAFESCSAGNCKVETRISKDGFANFQQAAVASGDLTFAIQPSIYAAGDGALYVSMTTALSGQADRFDIFSAASLDNGKTFSDPINISNTTESSVQSSILANQKQVYISWLDRTPGNADLFLSRSTDQGATFSPSVNITNNITISQVPTLITDQTGSVQLIYEDEMDGNDEIYYRRLTGSAPAKITALDPNNGPAGTKVLVRGSELSQTSAVMFGGLSAQFFLSSANELVAIVPDGARTGLVTVVTPAGSVNSATPFTVTSAISAGPSTLDFGNTIAGQLLEPQPVVINNLSNGVLKINSLMLTNGQFQLVSAPTLPLQLTPNQSVSINVRFVANAAGPQQGQLKINSSDSVLPNITINLTGNAAAPVLTLLAPSGGEKLIGGQSTSIQWQVENGVVPSSFDLMLSIDGGQNFTMPIVNDLDANSRSFIWNVPSVKSKQARVLIIMHTSDGKQFIDHSRSNFKIKMKK